jgi:transketolase
VALARRLRQEPGKVWVFMSDGELQEGQTWEAFAALSFYQLDNMSIYIDVNGQQCDGRTKTVMSVEPIRDRLMAFGAEVHEVDGHDPDELATPARMPRRGKPLVVLARTDPCHGIDLLRRRAPKLHYIRFKTDQGVQTMRACWRAGRSRMIEIVSSPHRKNLVRWAKEKPEVLVLSADLTASCEADDFQQTYPNRFFSMGMAEQNMLGFAAGLAREGYSPFVHTFAVFLYRRPYDQLAMSIAYPNLPVRLLGFLPGILSPGGVTHQAIEDIAVVRALPNMTILECGDATEVESVLEVAHSIDGPVYVRMLRGEVARLFDPTAPVQLGRPRTLSHGSDITIFSSGICTEETMRAAAALRRYGVSCTHLHVSTLKPFADPALLDAAAAARYGVITVENHGIIGGLGTATAEMMADAGVGRKLVRLGLRDNLCPWREPTLPHAGLRVRCKGDHQGRGRTPERLFRSRQIGAGSA